MAKKLNIPVHEFSIGIGPKVFHKGIFSIRALPLAGFCRIDVTSIDHLGKRLLILIAGPMFNIISALITIMVVFSIIGYSSNIIQTTNNPILEERDKIVRINGNRVHNAIDISEVLSKADNSNLIKLEIIRGVERIQLEMQVFSSLDGISLNAAPVYKKGLIGSDCIDLLEIWRVSLSSIKVYTKLAIEELVDLIYITDSKKVTNIPTSGKSDDTVLEEEDIWKRIIPTGTISSVESDITWDVVLCIYVVFSLYAALCNLMPLSILDGGKIVLALVEKLFRIKLKDTLYFYGFIADILIILGIMFLGG